MSAICISAHLTIPIRDLHYPEVDDNGSSVHNHHLVYSILHNKNIGQDSKGNIPTTGDI